MTATLARLDDGVNEANAGIQIENGLSGLKNGDNEPVSSLNHIFDNKFIKNI